jgi:hypothetical protein
MKWCNVLFLLAATTLAASVNGDPLRGATGGYLGLKDRPKLEQRLDNSRVRDTMTVNEAISIAEQRYGGRAVGAKKLGSTYQIRILQDNGKIKNVTID